MNSVLIFFLLSFVNVALGITPFEERDDNYSIGSLPNISSLVGYWGGNCVASTSPTELRPGILVIKKDSATVNLTLSYFWEHNPNPNLFLTYSPAAVEKYPAAADWFSKEQWQPVAEVDLAWSNAFDLPDGTRLTRSLREYLSEFGTTYLLRVAKVTGMGSEILNYCSFSKELKPEAAVLLDVVYTDMSYKTVILKNIDTGIAYQKISVSKMGVGRLRLSSLSMTLADGKILNYGDAYLNGTDEVAFGSQTPFKLKEIRFFADGAARQLRVRGIE